MEYWILKFRAANIDDLVPLISLEQKVIEAERPYNSSIKNSGAHYYDIENLISSDESYMLIAEVSGDIVATGYATIRASKPSLSHEIDAYLGFMYVHSDYRGQGVNKGIVDRLIMWSRDNGANDLYLDVYSENTPAISAYIKAGFSPSIIEMKLNL